MARARWLSGGTRVINLPPDPLGGLWCYRIGNYSVVCDIEDVLLCVLVVRKGGGD